MVKRIWCLFIVFILLISFSAPAFAVSNTVGVVYPTELSFLGFSTVSNFIEYPAIDGVCYRSYSNTDSSLSLDANQYIYFFWQLPYDLQSPFTCSGVDLFVSGLWTFNGGEFYGANYTGWNSISLTRLNSIYALNGSWNANSSYFSVAGFTSSSLSGYEYLVLGCYSSAARSIPLNFSFSESAEPARNISLSPSSLTTTTFDALKLEPLGNASISTTGQVGFGTLSSSYYRNSTYNPTNLGTAILASYTPTASSYADGITATYFTSATILSNIFGTINSTSPLITTKSSGTIISSSYEAESSSTIHHAAYSGTLEEGASKDIIASSVSDILVSATLNASYGDDGGLVDTVKNMDSTLTDIAGDMQTIVDDMTAKADAAAAIGGSTTSEQISDTSAAISSGGQSVDSLISSITVDGIIAPASNYITLLTAMTPTLFNFGNGFLMWALTALVIGSVLIYWLRRM